MVDAAVATPLPTPVWINHYDKECRDSDTLGCMVTHRLCHPELCFIGDEVGNNISMKGDVNAGGKILCTKQGTSPYEKASSTDKKFTKIGLSVLDGNHVMCLLIFQGRKRICQ